MNTRLQHTLSDVRGIPAALAETTLAQLPEPDRRELVREGVITPTVRITHAGWEVIRTCRP